MPEAMPATQSEVRPIAPPALVAATDDRLTIIAFAILVGFLAAIMHEGLGHALVAYLQGAKELTITNCYLNSDLNTRAIDAAGTFVNQLVGVVAWLALRIAQRASLRVRYYLWLTMTVNLFEGTGYFFYSGVAGIGDWQDVIKALHPYWLWRAGLVLLGAALYFGVITLSGRWLTRLIAGTANAQARVRGLTLLPYVTIGLAGSIAALPNLLGWKLIVISAAAATFGGLAGFLSVGPMVEGRLGRMAPPSNGAVSDCIPRNRFVIAVALLVLVLDIGVFGRGVTWRRGDPGHHDKVFLATADNTAK